MELRQALTQIAEIRLQMARGQVFRGYRSGATAFSGAVALATGFLQWTLLPQPATEPRQYVTLWLGAAVLSLAVLAAEMILRTFRSNSAVQRQLTLLAVYSPRRRNCRAKQLQSIPCPPPCSQAPPATSARIPASN